MKKRKYASGGNTWGTVGSVASGVFGGLQNAFGNNKSQEDKILYGDMWADPTQRMLNDFTGNGVKGLINEMNGNINTNIAPLDNNALFDRLSNIKRYDKKDLAYNTDVALGLLGNATGLLPLAPGFRYGKGAKNGIFSVDTDNLMASAQGAMSGLSYSGSPWGALVGGIAGGIFNYISDLTQNSKIRKYNKAVDAYNLTQNSITDQLINNSRLNQMNQYNSNYAKLGGPLNTHGGDFQNGVVEIANGGTHEENPYEGVPMGMDQKGVPNLVEEGEYIWNDYVFSKRIDVPEDMRKKYKFGGKLSFADAVDKVQKESEERPNDPISKRGLNAILSELAMSQEIERQKQQQQEAYEEAENVASMFADGGPISGWDPTLKKRYPRGDNLESITAYTKWRSMHPDKPYPRTFNERLNAYIEERKFEQAVKDQQFRDRIKNSKVYKKLDEWDNKYLGDILLKTESERRSFAGGGPIHIAENKRGTFTAAASKHNMGVQEFASHVLANKDKYSSTMVKKANFARNASKWHHALGGNLFKEGGPKKKEYAFDYTDPDSVLWGGWNTPIIDSELIRPVPENPTYNNPIVKNVGWAYTYPENRPKTWDGSLYNLPFYPSDSIDKTIVTTNGVGSLWEIPYDAPDNNPIISSAPNITGNEITLSSPLTSDFIYRPVVTNKSTPVIPTKELDKLSQPSEFEDFPSAEWTGPDGTLNVNKAAAKSANNNKRTPYNERFRYAPLAGAIGALLNDLRPIDYSNADRVGNAARSINRYRGYDPLSGYMEYRPVDINALTARMNAQQAADRRALLNMSNGNPAAATLMALAARYNDSRGDMLSKVDEINTARRNAVAGFNTDIRKTNSQLDLTAQQMNQRAEQMYLSGITQEAAIRNALEAAQSGAVSNDYHSIFDSLGGIGKENAEMNMIYEMGMPFYYQDSDGNRHIVYRNSQKKCGGKLFKVKK